MAVQPKTLRFRARGQALVQDYERLEIGIKKFLGWRLEQKAPPADPTNPEDKGTWAFEESGEVAEVPNRAEYRKACQDKDLWPADEETARACGVPFDPNFGGPKPTEKPAVKAEKAA